MNSGNTVTKWEYCELFEVSSKNGHSIYVNSFMPKQQTYVHRPNCPSWQIEFVVSELGEKGWEMCGCLQDGEGIRRYYFKRPMQ